MIFPLFIAMLLGVTKHDIIRGWIIRIATGLLGLAALILAMEYFKEPVAYYLISSEIINIILLTIEIGIAVYIIYIGIRYKTYLVSALAFIQTVVMTVFEFRSSHKHAMLQHHLFVDKLSIIMVLIIAIIGGLICIFAIPYMKEYTHHHPELKDRRRLFFTVVFVFLAAMFGIVLSNDLIWIYFFWEITTLCSFLLIGYTESSEAKTNAFTALKMNLIGGVAFAIAVVYLGSFFGITELKDLLKLSGADNALVIPAALLAVAALSKSAQLPFSKWLLGAMVAPTPTSALLHSSTMVKAGVYLLIRISPLLAGNIAGVMVMLVGGVTFLLMSCIAISQSDAKKVLAYSTMANLGLIAACCGIGNYEAIWAAVMLIIFHAVSKSLLFLSVGATEHVLGSRDIEDMHGLIVKLPSMAIMMTIGIAGMFLAPFGMLISKWAAFKAFIDSKNIILIIFLAYGSAVTLFYWTKWLGKIASIVPNKEKVKSTVTREEWFSLGIHAGLTVSLCLLFPIISELLIVPFLRDMFHITDVAMISQGNQYIMAIMLGLIFVLPVGMHYLKPKEDKIVTTYMGGINKGDNRHFEGALGEDKKMCLSSWYMQDIFGEKKLLPGGILVATALIVIVFALMIGGVLR